MMRALGRSPAPRPTREPWTNASQRQPRRLSRSLMATLRRMRSRRTGLPTRLPPSGLCQVETLSWISDNETSVIHGDPMSATDVPAGSASRARSASHPETLSRITGNETQARHAGPMSTTDVPPGSMAGSVSHYEIMSRLSGNETPVRPADPTSATDVPPGATGAPASHDEIPSRISCTETTVRNGSEVSAT